LMVAGRAGDTTASALSTEHLHYLGQLSRARLLQVFRESAVYLCCSRYEPFGLAPLEAALCGCAVLANDIPSLREVWGSGALYFRDAASLSRILAQLHDSPSLLQEAMQRSYQRACRYSTDRMVDGYLEFAQTAMWQKGAHAYA
jgi:glycogen(starch) synthase